MNLFHVLGVVPFLVYLAIVARAVPDGLRIVLVVLGALLILYHGAMAVVRVRKPGADKAAILRTRLPHVLIAGPLFIYMGLADTTPPALPAVVAALVFLFHSARLAQHLNASRQASSSSRASGNGRASAREGVPSEKEMLVLEAAI